MISIEQRVKLRHQESKHLPRGIGKNRGDKNKPSGSVPQPSAPQNLPFSVRRAHLTDRAQPLGRERSRRQSCFSLSIYTSIQVLCTDVNLHPFSQRLHEGSTIPII